MRPAFAVATEHLIRGDNNAKDISDSSRCDANCCNDGPDGSGLRTSRTQGTRTGERAIPRQQRLRGARLRRGPAGLVTVQRWFLGARRSLIFIERKKPRRRPGSFFCGALRHHPGEGDGGPTTAALAGSKTASCSPLRGMTRRTCRAARAGTVPLRTAHTYRRESRSFVCISCRKRPAAAEWPKS